MLMLRPWTMVCLTGRQWKGDAGGFATYRVWKRYQDKLKFKTKENERRLIMKGQKFLKVTGILMIIGGAFGIIAGIVAILGVSGLAALSGSAAGTGLLYAASFLCLISGIVQLIAGIQGVKNCTKPELAQKCIVWGAIVAVLSVLGNVLNMVGGSGFSVTSLATGLILPALYIYGAYLNKKEN